MPNFSDNIGATLAAVIALGLALQSGVGPSLMFIVEAFKSATKGRYNHYAGVMALVAGAALGGAFGGLTAGFTEGSGFSQYLFFGAVAGIFMGAGAIKTFEASGNVNTSVSAAIANSEPLDDGNPLISATSHMTYAASTVPVGYGTVTGNTGETATEEIEDRDDDSYTLEDEELTEEQKNPVNPTGALDGQA